MKLLASRYQRLNEVIDLNNNGRVEFLIDSPAYYYDSKNKIVVPIVKPKWVKKYNYSILGFDDYYEKDICKPVLLELNSGKVALRIPYNPLYELS